MNLKEELAEHNVDQARSSARMEAAALQAEHMVGEFEKCLASIEKHTLTLNDGRHVMQSLRDDITAIANHNRKELARVEQLSKDEAENHKLGEFGAHSVIRHQFTWHRRALYVFAGAFMTLGGWSLMLSIFMVKTHPEFIDMIWAWVK